MIAGVVDWLFTIQRQHDIIKSVGIRIHLSAASYYELSGTSKLAMLTKTSAWSKPGVPCWKSSVL